MLSDGYELVERDGAPDGADFCLTVTDDCMELYIRRGERVYVQASAAPGEFEAGIFMLSGRVYCRQWCEDYTGTVHLLAANRALDGHFINNPARQDANIAVPKAALSKLACLGRVMTGAKLPRPAYM